MSKETVEEEVAVTPKVGLGRVVRLCVAAWLLPGFGHLLLGRKWRALILFASIISLFGFGLVMKGEFFSVHANSYLQSLGYFGEMAVGVVMPAAKFFGYEGGDPRFPGSGFGTAYLVSAGMLNVLALLDAYDIALGRKP